MTTLPEVDDLRLVRAIAATGSLGAAARQLQMAQPSVSQRLARLERRVGVPLFRRDTQGARPTPAGAEMVRQAEHILGHLERVFDVSRAASTHRRLGVGTIASLAATVLPALEHHLAAPIDQRVDHGDRLVEWVDEGSLDAAVIAIADRLTLPRGLRVHPIGSDDLMLFLPNGVAGPGGGRQPLREREVVFATYDDSGEAIQRRLARLGAQARPAATIPTAVAMARRSGLPAVVPRSAVADPSPGERLCDLAWRHRLRLSMVTAREVDRRLLDALPGLRTELGLD